MDTKDTVEVEVGNQVVFVAIPAEVTQCPNCQEQLDPQAIYWTTDESQYIVNNDCPKCGRTVSVPWS